MRIIAGLHRSRRLKCPEGTDITRPITDRVKQALFDRLASREVIASRRVLDIFCGVGSMGLECLSRGAGHVIFVEKHPKIIQFLNENIQMLDYEGETQVERVDAFAPHWSRRLEQDSIGLCFCDPPYPLVQSSLFKITELMTNLVPCLANNSLTVLRTPKRTDLEPIPGLATPETFNYGGMNLHLYTKS